MNAAQRLAAISMIQAVLGVSHIDALTQFRAKRLLSQLSGTHWTMFA